MSTHLVVTAPLEDLDIPRHLQAEARHVAACINSTNGEIRERALTIGELLLSMKLQLARGVFVKWVKTKTNVDIRTAQNYMLASALTRDCPQLKDDKSFSLDALYKLGRLADTDEHRATLLEIVTRRQPAKSAEVIAELKSVLGLPETKPRQRALAAPIAPGIASCSIEFSAIEVIAAALGGNLAEFVDLVRNFGAVAVCDALATIHRAAGNESLSLRGPR